MKIAGWMAAGSVVSAFAVTAMPWVDTVVEVWLGMAAPLVTSSVEWILTERTHRSAPDTLTAFKLRIFAAKLVFFGVYVAMVMSAGWIRPVPFIISFTAFFLALNVVEAGALYRLTRESMRQP